MGAPLWHEASPKHGQRSSSILAVRLDLAGRSARRPGRAAESGDTAPGDDLLAVSVRHPSVHSAAASQTDFCTMGGRRRERRSKVRDTGKYLLALRFETWRDYVGP